MTTLDKTWHLAETKEEIAVTEFELQLWRVFYGFIRWQEECEKTANGTDLTGNELAIVHIVRMKNRPKSVSDIGRLLNRDDVFNIQYSIRKLLKKRLIKKVVLKKTDNSKRTFAYQITDEGIKNTDTYTKMRKSILIDLFIKDQNLNLTSLADTLAKLKAVYDEADRALNSYAAPLLESNDMEEPVKRGKKSKTSRRGE
jgi:predicted MarR family transcription regulator